MSEMRGGAVADSTDLPDDLAERYELFCQLETALGCIEFDDLTYEDLVELVEVFRRIARDSADQDWSNVVQLPSQPRLAGARASWERFRDSVSRERERLGRLIGMESTPVLPANVTDIGERRSRR